LVNRLPIFRINHYVGAVLAQGGNIWLDDSMIVFSPTSAIDRAMGAKDVHIPFQNIQHMEFKGELLRTFLIRTEDKTHKFEGSQAKSVWDLLEKAVHVKTTEPAAHAKAAPARALACEHCHKPLEAGFSFCPACATRIKAGCPSCHRAAAPGWSACAFCGWKFSAS
jgi:hypothetical protein